MNDPRVVAYWRTGRRVGRTIYAMHLDVPTDSDELIGTMDSFALANEAVIRHNAAVRIEAVAEQLDRVVEKYVANPHVKPEAPDAQPG